MRRHKAHGGAAGARTRPHPPSSWQRDRSPPARPVADGPIVSGAFSRWTRSHASGAGARCGSLRSSLTGPSSIAFSRISRRAPPWHARTDRAGRRSVARRCNNGRSMLRPPPRPAHPWRRDSVPGASTGAAWRARTLALGPPSVASNAWCPENPCAMARIGARSPHSVRRRPHLDVLRSVRGRPILEVARYNFLSLETSFTNGWLTTQPRRLNNHSLFLELPVTQMESITC